MVRHLRHGSSRVHRRSCLYPAARSSSPHIGSRAGPIGHEMSGRVIAVGDGVQNFAVSDRVVACPIIGCQQCRWCRSGSMAQCDKVAFLGSSWWGGALSERLNLYAYQCYHLPDSINDEVGALVEPFSATVRAVAAGHIGPEDNVAIVGAGPIGLMALLAATLRGAKQSGRRGSCPAA